MRRLLVAALLFAAPIAAQQQGAAHRLDSAAVRLDGGAGGSVVGAFPDITDNTTTDTVTVPTLNARNVVVTALATPTITSPLVVNGTPGATTYGYKRVDYLADGTSTAASAEVTIATGNATLSAVNSITVSWPALTGSVSTRLYRTTGGAAPPKLIYTGTATTFDDIGAAGTAQTPATSNGTGRVLVGLGGSIQMSALAVGDSGISLAGYRSFVFGSGVGNDMSGSVAAASVSATSTVSGPTYNVYSGGLIKFYGASSYDLGLSRGAAAKSLAVGNGTAGDVTGSIVTSTYVGASPSGALRTSGYTTEALTLNTGGTGTVTSGSLAPASSRVVAITGRVTTTITTAANYTVAPTGTAAWVLAGTATSALTGLAAGSTFTLVPPSGATYSQDTANTLTVTTNANPGAGAIRFVVFSEVFTPPTS